MEEGLRALLIGGWELLATLRQNRSRGRLKLQASQIFFTTPAAEARPHTAGIIEAGALKFGVQGRLNVSCGAWRSQRKRLFRSEGKAGSDLGWGKNA